MRAALRSWAKYVPPYLLKSLHLDFDDKPGKPTVRVLSDVHVWVYTHTHIYIYTYLFAHLSVYTCFPIYVWVDRAGLLLLPFRGIFEAYGTVVMLSTCDRNISSLPVTRITSKGVISRVYTRALLFALA